MTLRGALIGLLILTLLAAFVAGVLALDPLLFHGFAPACSDGYAEAHGTPSCKPDWDRAAPYLWTVAVAVGFSAFSAILLLAQQVHRREEKASSAFES